MSGRKSASSKSEMPVSLLGDGGSANGGSKAPDFDIAVLLSTLLQMRNGDFSVRLPNTWTGLEGKVADTFNEIVAANEQMASELKRIGQVVGKEGRTRERARFQ